jgi:flagellar biogenesis protein FliO
MQFIKKTSSRQSIINILIRLFLFLVIILGAVFLLNKIDFPAPTKEIQKIIPNENFKIVK